MSGGCQMGGFPRNRGVAAIGEEPSGLSGAGLQKTHPRRPPVPITVSVTVAGSASGTSDDLEPLVVEAGQQAMRAAVPAACRAYARQVMACRACQSDALHSDGPDARRLLTRFGRVHLPRRRRRCEGCGRRLRPADPF
jgi:hypothetical protein